MAPDGSPVELYLALPGDDEGAFIHGCVARHSAILELGCGAGRVTRHLVALGHPVTGVDNSSEMLDEVVRIEGAEPVLADIRTLDLTPRRWPVVLLASHLINDECGLNFLATAARHVEPDGCILVQRLEPGWVDQVTKSVSRLPDLTIEMRDINHAREGVLSATMVYGIGSESFEQTFVAYDVDDARFEDFAARVQCVIDGVLDEHRGWVRLRPRGAPVR